MTSQEFSFLQEMVARMVARMVASGGGLLSPATNWTGRLAAINLDQPALSAPL